MDPFEAGEKTVAFFKKARTLPIETLSKLFAYLIAPGIVALFGWVALGFPGTLFASEYSLNVTELASYREAGEPRPHAGVALMIEASRDEYSLPLSTGSRRVITSLTPEEWARNRERVVWAGSDLSLKLPFIGVSRPIIILAEGKPGKELLIAGGKIPLDRLQVATRRSVSLLTWAFIAAVFGIGLGVASEDAPVEQARSEERPEKDEH